MNRDSPSAEPVSTVASQTQRAATSAPAVAVYRSVHRDTAALSANHPPNDLHKCTAHQKKTSLPQWDETWTNGHIVSGTLYPKTPKCNQNQYFRKHGHILVPICDNLPFGIHSRIIRSLRSGFSTANQTPISLIADQHGKMISDQARRCFPSPINAWS